MALFTKYIDTIEDKRKELLKLQEESNDSLDLVTKTINSLSSVNEKIDSIKAELNEAKDKICSTEYELDTQKSKNERIITRFKELIGEV